MSYLFDGDFTIDELVKGEVQIEDQEDFNEKKFNFDRLKNISDNIRFAFNNIQQVILFSEESTATQAKIISDFIKSYIRTTGKNRIKDVYYYDEEYKIWICVKYSEFIYFFYQFFNNVITEIKKLPIYDEIEYKAIEKICKAFDKKTYIKEISKLILRELKDSDIVK